MAGSRIALATVPERVSILETKVDNIEEKIDNLKSDVKEMHDCLDNTRDLLAAQLKEMSADSVKQHEDLGKKIKELEQFKQKWVYLSAGAIATLGWVTAHADKLTTLIK
jgi:methylthioribose-1-phosphate isomerase